MPGWLKISARSWYWCGIYTESGPLIMWLVPIYLCKSDPVKNDERWKFTWYHYFRRSCDLSSAVSRALQIEIPKKERKRLTNLFGTWKERQIKVLET